MDHFLAPFGSIFGSILDPFSGAFGARPKPLILHSLQAGQADPGAGARRISPDPSHLKNSLEDFLKDFLRRFSP